MEFCHLEIEQVAVATVTTIHVHGIENYSSIVNQAFSECRNCESIFIAACMLVLLLCHP